ncbi:arginine--tRNA ligase [Candidatus Microgenomates bacterium]|nr:arginine--tRNA ligase [Candidatus Microgenomates bacterium]
MKLKKVNDNLVDKGSIVCQLQELVWRAASEFDEGLKVEDIHLEHPQEESHGDYSANIAMAMFAQTFKPEGFKIKSPLDLAKLIVKNLPKTDYLEKVEVVPPGFINFWLSKAYLATSIIQIIKEKEMFGRSGKLGKQKIMVEFAHPNTHKPFHIGHLRNITLGESIVRILEANGVKVIRTNYQGDVGLHIAKCLWAIKKQKTDNKKLKTLDEKIEFLGKAYAEGNKAYEEDEKAKEEIIKINGQIYNQDPKIIPLWQETRQWSLDYFDRIYKRVYSKFDRLYFESEVVSGKEVAKEAVKKGILKESEGAIIFDGEKYGLDTRVFINSLDFPTYEGKELRLSQLEFSEFGEIDKCIHVVGPEQTSFFKVTFKVEELLDSEKFKDKQYHLVYGWVKLKKGKMASRLGNVVLGEWLIDEVKKRLLKEFKMSDEVAEIVTVGAVKYSFLKFSPSREIVFDIDESINMEGDSGPYLQYAYARARSVLRKSEIRNSKSETNSKFKIRNSKLNKEEIAVLRTLYKFPEVVKEAGKNYAPNLICNYLFDLAQKFNGFYNKHSIINAKCQNPNDKYKDEDLRDFRLALTIATAQVLQNGLNLLGIKALEKM